MSGFIEEEQVWTTREGVKIAIVDMGDRHLRNTIALLRRTAGARRESVINTLSAGTCQVSGEMALDALESELVHVESMDDEEFLEWGIPQYENMLLEAEKRGLVIP